MLTLDQLGIIITIIGVFVAIAYYTLSMYKMMRTSAPKIILQRFRETVEKPVKSNWSIRILHPDKPIEKCRVIYNNHPLPWWDKDVPYYERTIEASGGGNVRIPIEIEKKDAKVKIKDGKRTLKSIKFREITEPEPVGGSTVERAF
jgi:hypothetical protein